MHTHVAYTLRTVSKCVSTCIVIANRSVCYIFTALVERRSWNCTRAQGSWHMHLLFTSVNFHTPCSNHHYTAYLYIFRGVFRDWKTFTKVLFKVWYCAATYTRYVTCFMSTLQFLKSEHRSWSKILSWIACLKFAKCFMPETVEKNTRIQARFLYGKATVYWTSTSVRFLVESLKYNI